MHTQNSSRARVFDQGKVYREINTSIPPNCLKVNVRDRSRVQGSCARLSFWQPRTMLKIGVRSRACTVPTGLAKALDCACIQMEKTCRVLAVGSLARWLVGVLRPMRGGAVKACQMGEQITIR